MVSTLLSEQLLMLKQLLLQLSSTNYIQKTNMLGDASIGQHIRHVIELLQCLNKGYESGTLNYDDRKRDSKIETDKDFSLSLIDELIKEMDRPDKKITLIVSANGQSQQIETFYLRELAYNAEHAIHHMALIKVALREMQLNITDENFGMAYATIQYKHDLSCAQ